MVIEWRPIGEYDRDPLVDCRNYLVKRETVSEHPDTGEELCYGHYIHVASPTSRGWWVRNRGFVGMSGGTSCFYLTDPTHFCEIEEADNS